MKKLSLSLFSFLACLSLFSQIPNSDMENWTSAPTLIGWETNSQPFTLPPFDPYIVKKDSISYTGKWAADLHANGVFKAWAKTIFAVQTHPDHLSLYYRLFFAPCVNDSNYPTKDTASILVELLNQGSTVDMGFWQSSIANFDYTQLIIPISQNAATFDSCRITLMGGDVLGGCGIVAASTEFIVDHLELKYTAQNPCMDSSQVCDTCICPQVVDPVCGCNHITYTNYCYAHSAGVASWTAGACLTGIKDPSTPALDLQLFPIPATGILNVQYELVSAGHCDMRISNILGQVLMIEAASEIPGLHQTQIDLSNFTRGIYLLELQSGRERVVKKFVVE